MTIVGASFLANLIAVPFLIGIHVRRDRVTCGLVHLLGVWLMLCFAPFTAFLNGKFESYDFFNLAISDEFVVTANALILLWVICFHYCYSGSRRPLQRGAGPMNTSAVGILLQIGVAFLSLAYIYDKVGFGVLTRRGFEEAVTDDTTIEIVLLFGPVRMASVFALVAGTWYLFQNRGHRLTKLLLSVLLPILASGTVLINNPVAAPRFFVGSVVTGIAFLLWLRTGKRALPFVLATLAIALFAFPVDIGRYSVDFADAVSDIAFSLDSGFRRDDFRTYETIIAALYFVEKWGAVHGVQLLGNILFIVPRSVWESKAVGTGTFLAQSFGESFTNVACPLPCEALVNFGIIGVPIVAIVFGWLVRRLDNWYWQQVPRAKLSLTAPLIVYPFLLGNMFFLTRGDLLNPLAFSVTMVLGTVPLFLGGIIERWLKRQMTVALR